MNFQNWEWGLQAKDNFESLHEHFLDTHWRHCTAWRILRWDEVYNQLIGLQTYWWKYIAATAHRSSTYWGCRIQLNWQLTREHLKVQEFDMPDGQTRKICKKGKRLWWYRNATNRLEKTTVHALAWLRAPLKKRITTKSSDFVGNLSPSLKTLVQHCAFASRP